MGVCGRVCVCDLWRYEHGHVYGHVLDACVDMHMMDLSMGLCGRVHGCVWTCARTCVWAHVYDVCADMNMTDMRVGMPTGANANPPCARKTCAQARVRACAL